MPENKTISSDTVPEAATIEATAAKFERERLSRRQALKRFGITSAMATFAMFSVDDLAHMVGKAMQQRAGDNKIAEQVAREFNQAGVVFASSPSASPSAPAQTPCANCCLILQAKNGSDSAKYQGCLHSGDIKRLPTCDDVFHAAICDNWAAYGTCIGTQTCPDCSTNRCKGVTPPSPSNPSPSRTH